MRFGSERVAARIDFRLHPEGKLTTRNGENPIVFERIQELVRSKVTVGDCYGIDVPELAFT